MIDELTMEKAGIQTGLIEKDGAMPARTAPEQIGTTPPTRESTNRPKGPRGLWWKLLLVAVLGLMISSYFLPQILSQPGILASVLNGYFDEQDARFELEGVSLGWGQPIALSGLTIRDAQGDILTLGQVQTTASLWEILQQKTPVHQLLVTRPHLNLVIDEQGTNVERLLDRLSSDDDSPAEYDVRITEGSAHVDDRVKGEQIDVSEVEAEVKYASVSGELSAKTRFNLTHNTQSGKFALDLEPTENGYQFITQTGDVPLALLAPLIERELPGLNLRGTLNGTIEGIIPRDAQQQAEAIEIDLVIKSLEASGRGYLGDAIFTSPEAKIRGRVEPNSMAVDLTSELTSWAIDEPLVPGSSELKRVWSNSASDLQFKGRYDTQNNALLAEHLRLDSVELALNIAGSIKEFLSRQVFDLTGQLAVDQRLLDNIMQARLTSINMRVDNLKTGEFRLQGPLWTITPASDTVQDDKFALNPEFSAATNVSWNNLGFETFDLGPGTMDVGLQNNVLKLAPTPVQLLGGRVDLTSAFDITNPDDPVIMIPAGLKIQRAGINTDLSRRWLLYVSPLFAEATSIEGTFSLELPEIKAKASQIGLQRTELFLTFHQARLGPGPLMQQVAGMISNLQATIGREPGRGVGGLVGGLLQPDVQWIGVPEQRVTLVVDQGQVAHRDLVYQIGDVRMASSGSIGANDGRLNLAFGISIPDAWTRDRPLLAGFRGQVIQIGLAGTLSQPQLDLRNLADFGKQLGAGAIGGLIDNLIERRRNRR